jgi:hypothetical protein
MNLREEIYNFFNEARPRTVNKDVEDIRKGTFIMKGDGPKDIEKIEKPRRAQRTAPPKQGIEQLPAEKQGKSSFEKGKVHEIIFKNKFRGQPRKFFTLFRKISEEEYKKITREFDISPKIFPSDKEEHFEDIYYLTPEMGVSIEKDGFFSLSKKQLKDIQNDYPEYTGDLKPVSMEDVIKGVNLRYYSIDELKKQWDIKKSYKEKRKEKSDKKSQKDIEKDQKVKDEIGSFLAANDSVIANMISSFNKMRAIGATSQTIKDYGEFLDQYANRFVERIKKEKIPVQNGIFQRLGEKLKDKPQVFNIIKDKYAGKDTAIDVDAKDEPKTQKDKKDIKTQKDKKEPAKKGETLNAEEKAKKYMIDGTHVKTINNFIQAYAKSEERDEKGIYVYDREEREYQRNQMFTFIPKIMNQISKYSTSSDVRKEIINSIKDRVVAIVGKGTESKESNELNNILSKAYDNMESEIRKEKAITEAVNRYLVKTEPKSAADSAFEKVSKTQNVDKQDNPIPGEYLVSLEDEQVVKLKDSMKDKGLISIDLDKTDTSTPQERKPEDVSYKVSVKTGGREQDGLMTGKNIVKYLKTNPEYSDITFKDLKEKEPYTIVGKEGDEMVITIKSLTPSGQFGKRTAFDTIDAKQAEKNRKENEPETRKVTVKIPYQTPQTVSYSVNKGVKMAKKNPEQFIFKFYVVDTDKNEIVKGFNDWGEAKKVAQEMGPKYKAMQKGEVIKSMVNEALSKEDQDKLMSTKVKFTIKSNKDVDNQYNISDNVANFEDEKTTFVINLKESGTLTFSKNGPTIFKYAKDNEEYQVLNVPQDLESIVKKSFESKEKGAESTLEAYIRKRIQKALQETELNQYFSVQGPAVKKKRLEEYMKKYEWGFQKSEDPYVRGIGSEKHAIVNKLVHELGDEGVAVYNSYAPKGYEIARPDDLNDMADTPLGSQLYQPYDPNSLTARGGRVAEADEKEIDSKFADNIPMDQQLKNAEELAKDYMRDRTLSRGIQKNPNLGHVEKTIVNFIRKASERGNKKDIKSDSEIMKALRVISDRQMNKY